MTSVKTTAILTLIFFSAFSPACSGNANKAANSKGSTSSNQANVNANAVKSNIEELGLLVTVPYEAEDVVWKEYPSQKRIVAVLRFSPADSAKLIAEAEKFRKPETAAISSETWFPAELIAQSEMSGEDNLNGRSYAANQFFQEPYSSGRLIRIDNTDYFVLDITAK